MTKVLHIITGMNLGGAETMVMNFFRCIDKNSVSFDFFVDFQGDNYYEPEINKLGGKIYKSGGGKLRHPIKYAKNLCKVLKDGNYDIIHVHASTATGYIPLMISKLCGVKKRVIHSHNTRGGSPFLQKLRRVFVNAFATDRLSCGKAAAVWMYGKKADRATVISPMIDCKEMKFDAKKRECLRKEWGVEDKLVFGHIGRMNQQKNPLYLIRLFNELRKINPNTYLVYLGSGELQGEINDLISSLGLNNDVRIYSNIPSSDILSGMDSFILPSLYEGFPTVALEAQANGLSTFLSDTITPDIKVTKLVHFISLNDDITDTARFIIDNSFIRDQSATEYVDIVGEKFSVEKVTQQLMSIYFNL